MPRHPTGLGWLGLTAIGCGALLAPSSGLRAGVYHAGVVRDTSGAVLPGVTVEAASDVLIEKVRTAVTDGTGRTDRRSAGGHLCGHIHAAGFRDRQTRGHRADRSFDGDGQRGPARRRGRGNDHGHRRDADGGRAERAAAGDGHRRSAQHDSHRARLPGVMLLVAGDSDAGHVAGQRAGDARHGRVRHTRRPQRQRRTAAGGRPGRRRGPQRRRRLRLQRRHRQRAGDLVHGVGGTRRSRSRPARH